MQTLFKNSAPLLFALLLLMAMLGYRYFIAEAPSANSESALIAGEDLLKLSEELSRVKLSQELFSLPGYRYLTDFSVPVPNQTFGRTNPFDNFGR